MEDILKDVIGYLREQYKYCFWCSIQFDSSQDLADNCPGETEDCHD